MKTIKKKLSKAGVITKKGEVHNHYIMAILNSRKNKNECKIYPFSWKNKGRSAQDNTERLLNIIEALGYQFQTGNDSLRGGKNGDFIKLSRKAFNNITQIPQTL